LARDVGADKADFSGDAAPAEIEEWTRGYGADAVLITAATDSNQPIELAARVSRLKGRVIVVGMTGMDIPRQPFFSRELKLIISRSYGPGRYDPDYEERGHDYPLPYVRWTEKRNIESFLQLVGDKRINVERLTTHRFPIGEADRAYQLISGDIREPYLGVVLNYDLQSEVVRKVSLGAAPAVRKAESVVLGVIGAGGYVPAMLLPHFKSEGVEFRSIATASGISAHDVGKRYAFAYAVSSAEEVLDDPDVNLVVIGTRHDLHAELARKALERDKHVFVEKPLALNDEQLESVLEVADRSAGRLMVGFNRRFSMLAYRASKFFAMRETPLSILYRVNAGRVPKEHWIQDAQEGGGRIIGEVCHFVDLMQFLTGAPPVSVFAESISAKSSKIVDADSVFITLRFADGSIGSVAYLSEGDKGLAKERVEIFGDGAIFVLDDFRRATSYQKGREAHIPLNAQDKGQFRQVHKVCATVLGREADAPISLEALAATSRATFRALDSLRERRPFDI
jgi:predicted dehydrogenase